MQKAQKHRNRLAEETSPYLLQHAHNPVDWYPWSEEAFERAREEDKPVLLSIGYSACHWCHVMAHESFEDERIASLMNENFVNVKVDMEERPDVDKIYMNFVQLTTGSGGWPLTAFLTPDQRPFFGGTYFPPSPRFNMPSFEQILTGISEAYRERRDEVLHSANDIVGRIRQIGLAESKSEPITQDLLDHAYRSFENTFDSANGGFGGAPKFPAPMSLEFLLRYHKRTAEPDALEMVRHTAHKMADGGIFDQLGGGFHRYTVDAIWLVPHFEKMLYDNAQLIRLYLHLYQILGDTFYRKIAEQTLEYVRREMLDEHGGFYSSQDADSEGVEGKYFVWSPSQIGELLGEEEARIFCFYYDVSEEGNFEGKNILNVKNTISETASVFKRSEVEIEAVLDAGRKVLFAEREKRVKPSRDEKVLTAWNGLMLAAFAEAASVLDNKEYLEIAIKNARFLMAELTVDGKLFRTWKGGEAKLNAYLEDYANFADGLFELFMSTGESGYLEESKRLAGIIIDEFWDAEQGGFFFTSSGHEELLVRSKDYNDNATPSGNSVAFDVLAKLAKVYGENEFARYATTGLRLVASQIPRYAGAFGRSLSTLEFELGKVREIVIFGEPGNELESYVRQAYTPDAVLVPLTRESDLVTPLVEGKDAKAGTPIAYVCENFTCLRPAHTLEGLKEQMK